MHDGEGLVGLLTVFISSFLPSVSTFNAIKFNDIEAMEFVSRYWVVFGIWNALEFIANLIRFTSLIPGYAWMKLCAFGWMYLFGHDFFFHLLSPIVDDSEPVGAKILEYASQILPLMGEAANFVAVRLLAAIIRWQQEKENEARMSVSTAPSRKIALFTVEQRSLTNVAGPSKSDSTRLAKKSASLSPLALMSSRSLEVPPDRGHRSSENVSARRRASQTRRSMLNPLGVQPLNTISNNSKKGIANKSSGDSRMCTIQ